MLFLSSEPKPMSAPQEETRTNFRTWYLLLAAFLVGIILFFIGFSTLFS